jgi:hypothetical protein
MKSPFTRFPDSKLGIDKWPIAAPVGSGKEKIGITGSAAGAESGIVRFIVIE